MSRDNRLCHFCFCNIVENEAYFVLECPLYNSLRDKFQSLFKKVLLKSLQLDHQVEFSLYLTEATTLRHSRELAYHLSLVEYELLSKRLLHWITLNGNTH
jgi:hypothetical protein